MKKCPYCEMSFDYGCSEVLEDGTEILTCGYCMKEYVKNLEVKQDYKKEKKG